MKSHATVIIPLDDRVLFVRLFNRPQLSGRFSEVAQPFDAISGIQFLASGGGLGERWTFGAVRVSSRPAMRQGRLRRLAQLWDRFIDMSFVHSILSTDAEEHSSMRVIVRMVLNCGST
jgi:hypothetical protein